MDHPAPLSSNFELIGVHLILNGQIHEQVWTKVHFKLNVGGLSFEIDENGIVVRTGDKAVQIVALHSLNDWILHINHHSRRAGPQVATNSTI